MTEKSRTERVQLMMTPAELRAVDDWSFASRVRGRSEAIRRLVAMGLQAEPLLRQFLTWMETSPASAEVQGSIAELRKMLGLADGEGGEGRSK